MEGDGRATDDVVFDELVQIAVCLIEGDEVCVGWETVEEIQQRQLDAYTVFKYIDVLVVVEGGLFVDCLEKWRHVTVIVPYEVLAQRLHFVIAPHRLATSVVLIGDAFVREATEEGPTAEAERDHPIFRYCPYTHRESVPSVARNRTLLDTLRS